MSDIVIKTENLTKEYGSFRAVANLNMEIARGLLFGFIGPNGAGKTTTIRMLCGLLKPTSGRATVSGVDVVRHPREAKKTIGYLPELFGTYARMRVWEYLDFFGAAYRIPARKRRERIDAVMDLTGTEYMRDFYVGTLSKGMRQRVGIAKTLVHDPDVIVLDEPLSGLDPVARIEMRDVVKSLKELGKTVLVSSHILAEVSAICDEVGIIEKAKLLAIGPIKKIMSEVIQTRRVQVELLDRAEEAAELLKTMPWPTDVKVVGNLVQFEMKGDDVAAHAILEHLMKAGFPVCWMNEAETDLEEVFVRVTGRVARKPAGKKS